MTNRKVLIIAICSAVIFATVVGFMITLDVSPQIAFARLFIDVGLTIALVAIVLASGELAHRVARSSFGPDPIGAPAKSKLGPGRDRASLHDAF